MEDICLLLTLLDSKKYLPFAVNLHLGGETGADSAERSGLASGQRQSKQTLVQVGFRIGSEEWKGRTSLFGTSSEIEGPSLFWEDLPGSRQNAD